MTELPTRATRESGTTPVLGHIETATWSLATSGCVKSPIGGRGTYGTARRRMHWGSARLSRVNSQRSAPRSARERCATGAPRHTRAFTAQGRPPGSRCLAHGHPPWLNCCRRRQGPPPALSRPPDSGPRLEPLSARPPPSRPLTPPLAPPRTRPPAGPRLGARARTAPFPRRSPRRGSPLRRG